MKVLTEIMSKTIGNLVNNIKKETAVLDFLYRDTLRLPSKYYVDIYGMSEMNGLGVSCEGAVISIFIPGYIQ